MDRIHDFGLADHAGQGQAATHAFGHGDEIGGHVEVFHGEQLGRAAETGLDLVGDKNDAEFVADGPDLGEELRRGHHETAFTLDRLGHETGHLVGGCGADEELPQLVGAGGAALGIGKAERAAVAVGVVGELVHFGGHGAEAELIGFDLAGHGHGQKGAAVEGVFHGDDAGAAGVAAGDFHGVFHGFGTGIDEQGLLVEVAWGHLTQALRQADIGFIEGDHGTGVHVASGLVLDGGHDLGMAVADIEDADAADEINELAAGDVTQQGTLGRFNEERGRGGMAFGDVAVAQFRQFLRLVGGVHGDSSVFGLMGDSAS